MKRLACIALLLAACGQPGAPEPPVRARIRATLHLLADGVLEADKLCASASLERRDVALAELCASYYTSSRAALIAAEDALDVGDEHSAGCSAKPAVAALDGFTSAIQSTGARLPSAIVDAIAMADTLARLAPCATDGGQ